MTDERTPIVTNRQSSRGIALIAVIAAISALLLIAIPFSLSMRDHRQSATTFAAGTHARLGVDAVLAKAKADLLRTHESLDETPDFDTLAELEVSLEGLPFPVSDPRGRMWSVSVEDEQGKIQLDAASPFLLGNLLGVARVTTPVAPGDSFVSVDDASAFPEDGGLVWVGGEMIRYQSASDGALTGCERGIQLPFARFLDALEHDVGAVVLDGRAVLIAHLGRVVGGGQWSPLPTISSVKRVSELGPVAISPAELERLQAVGTVHSIRPTGAGFGNPQAALDPLAWFEEDDLGGRRLRLENAR